MTTSSAAPAAGDDGVARAARRWPAHRLILAAKLLGVVAAAAIVVVLLEDKLPSGSELWNGLSRASWWLVVLAAVLQVGSISLVARQQRLLMAAFGVRIGFGRMQAITYAGGAVSLSVPAGGAVSSGYAYRQFRAAGAEPAAAAAVMVLSGLLSTIGLVLLAGLAFGGAALADLWQRHPMAAVLWASLAVALVVAVTAWWNQRSRPVRRSGRPARTGGAGRGIRSWPGRVTREVGKVAQRLGQLRPAQLRAIVLASTGKWVLDLGCLYLSCVAVGLSPEVVALTLMFLGVQVVRQVPLTPGGAGLIEASLVAGLLATGAAQVPAAAAVLIYRLLSAWFIIPIGGLAMLGLRRGRTCDTTGAVLVRQ